MQKLSWWMQCLVLRTLPGSLLRREGYRIIQVSGSGVDDREEAMPLRPNSLPLPAGGTFKSCWSGNFCSAGTLAMTVIIVLLMHSCLDSWPASSHVRPLPRDFVLRGSYVKVQVDVLSSSSYVSDENRKCFHAERHDTLTSVIRKLK